MRAGRRQRWGPVARPAARRRAAHASHQPEAGEAVPPSFGPIVRELGKLGVRRVEDVRPVSGGSINAAYRITCTRAADAGGGSAEYFCKVNESAGPSMFRAEQLGLEAILATGAVVAPKPLAVGSLQNEHATGGSFALMEWLPLAPSMPRASHAALGAALARMHLAPPASLLGYGAAPEGQFGFWVDNTIGSTPQANAWRGDWAAFFGEQRLAPMAGRVARRFRDEDVRRRAARLLDRLPALMAAAGPIRPALIHGDLWFGNAAALEDGRPAVFDPAAYYAHAEADLGIAQARL
eukprot:tig00000361_g24379.t1